jgi:Flp pilus assembly protein TadD
MKTARFSIRTQPNGLFMLPSRSKLMIALALLAAFVAGEAAWAGDLHITIPRRSELTPVQKLNREGVEAVRKHDYEKAEAIFYKAYLYDPSDPFTLNNLGYVSEMRGNLDEAQKFYAMAAKQGCTAVVDMSSAKKLEGKPMLDALNNVNDKLMQGNLMNVEAVELLSQNRNFEAQRLLTKALALNPQDPFTLNNLAVAEEATGDLQDALKYYEQASATGSNERIVVTQRRAWRGKPVSEIAADSAQRLREKMQGMSPSQTQAMMLTYRGVVAANRNDWETAKKDFLEAYKLDPNDAFTLNNAGYVSERNGDVETAQFFYTKARQAGSASTPVGLATRSLAEGQPLFTVAADSDHAIDRELARYHQERRQETGPIELIPRGPGTANQPAPQQNQTPQH